VIFKISLFKPAIHLMHQLRYPHKFLLISSLFALPIVLLMFLLFKEISYQIDFAKKELYGTHYLRATSSLKQKVYWQSFLRHQLPERAELSNDINLAYQNLITVDNLYLPLFFTEKRFFILNNTYQIWQADSFKNPVIRNNLLDSLSLLNQYIGDKSNLILDPDLDTYYLMDTVLLKLPEIQKILFQIDSLSTEYQMQDEVTYRVTLIGLIKQLDELAKKMVFNMDIAYANTHLSLLHHQLSNVEASFNKETKQVINQFSLLIEKKPLVFSELDKRLVQKNIQESFYFWNLTIDKLDLLLQKRIDGFTQKRNLVTVFVVIILLVIIYLLIAFYLGMMQTVTALKQAAVTMTKGQDIESIQLPTKDELGQVVRSFNDIAFALMKANHEISLFNENLKQENNRLNAELDVSRRIQQMLLPKESELQIIKELDISGFMEPATEVGGDYYDILSHKDGVKIGIGDVTGHGLESGVLMIMVQTAIRTLLEHNETDTVKFFNTLNSTIYNNVKRMNCDKNLSLTLLDYQQGYVKFSGQHEDIILVRDNSEIELIDTIDLGFPIGLEETISEFIAESKLKLETGDGLVLYTDGITEAENMQHELYGIDRFCKVIKLHWHLTSQDIRHAIIADLMAYIGKQKIFDDITLLVIKQR
jgi:sigma-B regulation protein RsbU (phosphoserine phosphatase)